MDLFVDFPTFMHLSVDLPIFTQNSIEFPTLMKNVDLAIIFDIGDYKRLESVYKNIQKNHIYSVSIDHHPSDDTFFDYKFLDVTSPATGFLVWQYFYQRGNKEDFAAGGKKGSKLRLLTKGMLIYWAAGGQDFQNS